MNLINIRRLCTLSMALMWLGPLDIRAFTLPVGDIDGFGFSPAATLVEASGASADTDVDDLLEDGEFLPDLNGVGAISGVLCWMANVSNCPSRGERQVGKDSRGATMCGACPKAVGARCKFSV